jgi:hypothetical protein
MEKEKARSFLQEDSNLEAVQIFSHDKGLRMSVVSSKESALAESLTSSAIPDADLLDGPVKKVRYATFSHPLNVAGLPGLDAWFLVEVLGPMESRAILRNDLIAVLVLFILTLLMIAIASRLPEGDSAKGEPDTDGLEPNFAADFESPSAPDDMANDSFALPDEFKEDDDFLDEDFSLPDVDAQAPVPPAPVTGGPMEERLNLELERAASFNQDLVLILIKDDSAPSKSGHAAFASHIHESFSYQDLVFDYEGTGFAVIQINIDLDEGIALMERFVRDRVERSGSKGTYAGLASRNGRLIDAARLLREARSSLDKTSGEKNIVAFRSDPEKFRQYLKEQEG